MFYFSKPRSRRSWRKIARARECCLHESQSGLSPLAFVHFATHTSTEINDSDQQYFKVYAYVCLSIQPQMQMQMREARSKCDSNVSWDMGPIETASLTVSASDEPMPASQNTL